MNKSSPNLAAVVLIKADRRDEAQRAPLPGTVMITHSTFEMPSRETLFQWREGLLLQLRAIERILGLDTKAVETQERKR